MRFAMALVVGSLVLRDRRVLPSLWLIPLRDLVALLVWIASFAGHRVAWRGDFFTLKDGRLIRIAP
jgi:ceramide glucosyltransferase